MSKVWLITGSGRGLGREIAEQVLAHGDRLVAAARDPNQLSALVERYGDHVRSVALDVTDAAAARAAVLTALDAYGRLDVLVNNAGFGHFAPFEQADADDFRAQIDTNFHGVVNLTRAALPTMRAQRSGHILQISSVGGRVSTPGLSAYQAAKWAVGGFSEVLAKEVAPFGVKVCTLEPGGMRTGWRDEAIGAMPQPWPDYEAAFDGYRSLIQRLQAPPPSGHGDPEPNPFERGDPVKVAEVVLRLAYHDHPPSHLLLGSDALHIAGEAEDARAIEAGRWRAISAATDVAAATPIPAFPA